MKTLKWSSILVIIIGLLSWLGYREYVKYQIEHMFDNEDPYAKEKRVLIDSLVFNNNIIIYRFSYDSGVFRHSEDFLSICTDKKMVSKENSFFSSGAISSISKLGSDSLLIKLTDVADYKIDSSKLIIPCKIESEYSGIDIPRSKRLNIPIK